MGDTAERIVLEGEDQLTPVVDKANGALEGHERKAIKNVGGVIRIMDQSRSSVQRVIASVEKLADVYGKTGTARLIAERDQLLQRWNREPAVVNAVTQSYERMIAMQKKIDSEAKFAGIGEKIRQGMQNPLESVKSLLMGAGGWVAAGVGGLVALTAAGYEAAKSLGEYGTRIKDAELRTGLAAKEVGQFEFAAKAVGQEVSIVERIMKGLAEASDDTSKAGEKARLTLRGMGVTLRDEQTGSLRPTAAVLEDISRGLARIPAGAERVTAARALFSRAGIEAIPFMTELVENLKIAREKGYGPSEEEVQRFTRYQREVVELETSWGRLKRSMQEPLVAVLNIVAKVAGKGVSAAGMLPTLASMAFSSAPTAADVEMGETKGWGYGASMSLSAHASGKNLVTLNDRLVAQARDLAAAAVKGEDRTALSKAESDLSAAVEKLQTGVYPSVTDEARGQVATAAGRVRALKEEADLEKERAAWLKQAAEFEKRGDESELSAIGKIYAERDRLIEQAGRLKSVEADIAGIRKAADERVTATIKKDLAGIVEGEQKPLGPRVGGDPEAERNSAAWAAAYERKADLELQARRETIQRAGNRALRVSELSGAPEGEAIRTAYQIRIELAIELAGIEQERIDKELTSAAKLRAEAEGRAAVEKEAAEAMEEAQLKQLEMLHKQSEEIKGTAAGLFHTLFTKPQDFGKQLGSTLKEAALKPVTEGLGTITANVLHPLIFGATGEGGIAGTFRGMFGGGGRLQDVKLIGGAMPVMVMNGEQGAGGQGTGLGFGGFGSRTALTGLLAGGLAMGAGMAAVRGGEVIGGGSSTTGLTQLSSGLWSRGGAAGGGVSLPALLGGGGSGTAAGGGGFGISNVLRNFRSIDLGGLTRAQSHVFDAQGFDTGEVTPGKITGVSGLAGAGLSTGGMMLAQQGLLGSWRGTWGGIAAGAGGGAMIGMQMGGPWGAAIGAGVGAGIGIGEKLAGVESPENEAQRLVKQIYGIDIPQSSSVIKQIVEMAQQQYGGSVSMTVRTPAVRDLLQLYAESTGQKSNLFLSQPHGVNLTEANGVLNQSAVYNDGTPYTYASNLPVLGPAGGGVIPTGNPFAGGVTVQVSAEQTANLWATGTAAAIAGGSRAVAASAVNGQAASASRISGANVMLSPDVVAV